MLCLLIWRDFPEITLVERSRNGKGCIALSWLPGGLLPEPCFTLTLLSSALPSDRDSKMVVSRLLAVSFQLSLARGSHGGGSWGVDKGRAWAATVGSILGVSVSPSRFQPHWTASLWCQLPIAVGTDDAASLLCTYSPGLVAIPCSCQPAGCLTILCLAS